MPNFSRLANPNAETVLELCGYTRNSRFEETRLYDNGAEWGENRYLVTGPLKTGFSTYADLREAVADWSDNAAEITEIRS